MLLGKHEVVIIGFVWLCDVCRFASNLLRASQVIPLSNPDPSHQVVGCRSCDGQTTSAVPAVAMRHERVWMET